jgi:hypothetical protein
MKAIYINLDQFVAAARPYIAGDVDTPPVFQDQLPLAVTVPAGQSAALVCQTEATVDGGTQPVPFATWTATVVGESILSNALSSDYAPAMSGEFVTETASVYAVPATAAEINIAVTLTDGADENPKTVALPAITVLVRRETASGPVDLVDFTPPASGTPSAADIKSALVAAGSGALAGVYLDDAILGQDQAIQCQTGEATFVPASYGEMHDGDTISGIVGVIQASD